MTLVSSIKYVLGGSIGLKKKDIILHANRAVADVWQLEMGPCAKLVSVSNCANTLPDESLVWRLE